MSELIKIIPKYRIALSDILILALVYFLPTIIHLTALPLYLLEPMRIFIFLGLILSGNKRNAYLLALTIPLFSCITAGHPPFFKALIISAELFLNIYLFVQFSKKGNWPTAVNVFLSILISKVCYYGLKYLFLSFALISGGLVGISLSIQLAVAVLLSVVISFFIKKEGSSRMMEKGFVNIQTLI